jgi:hypothetical protein
MITTVPQTWGHKVLPPSYDDCLNSTRRAKRYEVEASSYGLFQRALEAKKSNWSGRSALRLHSVPLPPENVAAIKLLDSWLATPETDSGERAEAIGRRIDENRLSDRKLFS